jgi:outer membrane protein assembly factor BamB
MALLVTLAVTLVLAFPAAAGAQGGDGGNLRGNSAHTGAVLDARLRPPLHRIWTRRLTVSPGTALTGDGRLFVIAGRNVPARQRLLALDARSGAVLWSRELSRTDVGMAYGDGRVYVWQAGSLSAFAAADGAPLWQSGPIYGPATTPTYAGGAVYLGDSGVSAYRASDGAPLWRHPIDSGDTATAVAGEIVYAANSCGELYALRRSDGAVLWQVQKPGWNGCSGHAEPAVFADRIYLHAGPSGRGDVHDARTGARLWRNGTIRPPAVAHDTAVFMVFSRFGRGRLHARDAATGAPRWRFRGDGYLGDAPLIVNRVVYAGSGAGTLYGLSLRTGRVLWRSRMRGPIGGLAAGEGRLVVSSYRALVAYAR